MADKHEETLAYVIGLHKAATQQGDFPLRSFRTTAGQVGKAGE
ncbi:MAG: hypothetical protein WDA68_06180 [Phycisphaerae bacterium]